MIPPTTDRESEQLWCPHYPNTRPQDCGKCVSAAAPSPTPAPAGTGTGPLLGDTDNRAVPIEGSALSRPLRTTPDALGNVEAEDAELYFGPQTEERLRADNARLWETIRAMERDAYAAANSLDVAELDARLLNAQQDVATLTRQLAEAQQAYRDLAENHNRLLTYREGTEGLPPNTLKRWPLTVPTTPDREG